MVVGMLGSRWRDGVEGSLWLNFSRDMGKPSSWS